jgi:hypothetical protein
MNHPINNPTMNSIIANAVVIPHSISLIVVDTVVTRVDNNVVGKTTVDTTVLPIVDVITIIYFYVLYFKKLVFFFSRYVMVWHE